MASCLARLARAPLLSRHPFASPLSLRHFSASSSALARRARLEDKLTAEQAYDLLDDDFDDDDTTSAGHHMLREQRRVLHYMRLIEHEMPKLVAYRKPFIPPTSETPVIVRSLDYAGEEHPATAKRAIVVAVDHLPLTTAAAIHKFILLAGPRWTRDPPTDAGVSKDADWGHGYVKISCENFPVPSMNLKWTSDALDRLVAEANKNPEAFKNVPIDVRHLRSKATKNKRGDHLRGRLLNRPTIADFPPEWLPPNNS